MKHTHYFEGPTSFDDCHAHCLGGCVSNEKSCKCHKHKIKGETTCDDGHVHHYCLETGYDMPLPGGGHYHLIKGKVKEKHDHRHHVCLKTSNELPVMEIKKEKCGCKHEHEHKCMDKY